jgi:uncharacterized protein YchJ
MGARSLRRVSHRGALRRALGLAVVATLPWLGLPAQVIRIKTAPVADGDQFAFFPSANLGMGGVSITLADSLLDPFTNPAKGTRLDRSYVLGSPAVFSVSGNSGGGQTFPLGAFLARGTSFASVMLVTQRISPTSTQVQLPPPVLESSTLDSDVSGSPSVSHANHYAFLSVGHRIAAYGLSLGASALVSGLGNIDGTERLYPASQSVGQDGHATDLRLGMLKEWHGARSLELLVVHNRFGMIHDVDYLEQFWDPHSRQFRSRTRLERDADRVRVWGMQLKYERPLGAEDSDWRIGALVTANRQSRPAVANDEIMSIAQDEGHASAFDFGVGVSKSLDGSIFGIDAIYEPIWSHTWAHDYSADPAVSPQAGATTMDNRFRYSNAILRVGLGQDVALNAESMLRLQFGALVKSTDYRLDQHDVVSSETRRRNQRWTEWSWTWGAGFHLSSVGINYRGVLTTGTGRSGVPSGGDVVFAPPPGIRSFPIIPVSSPLADVHVTTHQLSVAVPIR